MLVFKNIKQEDEGTYTCKGIFQQTIALEEKVRFIVYGKVHKFISNILLTFSSIIGPFYLTDDDDEGDGDGCCSSTSCSSRGDDDDFYL